MWQALAQTPGKGLVQCSFCPQGEGMETKTVHGRQSSLQEVGTALCSAAEKLTFVKGEVQYSLICRSTEFLHNTHEDTGTGGILKMICKAPVSDLKFPKPLSFFLKREQHTASGKGKNLGSKRTSASRSLEKVPKPQTEELGGEVWNAEKAIPPIMEKINDQNLSVLGWRTLMFEDNIFQSCAMMSSLRSWGMLTVDGYSYRLQLWDHFFTQRGWSSCWQTVLQCSRINVQILFLSPNCYGLHHNKRALSFCSVWSQDFFFFFFFPFLK